MRFPFLVLLSVVLPLSLRAAEAMQTAARLLPPETLMFGEYHDLQRTVERGSQSSWGEMAREPEVQDFLAKLIHEGVQQVPGEVRATLDEIVKVAPSGGFFSLLEMPNFAAGSNAIPKMLFGVSYRGEAQGAEALLQRLREAILTNAHVKDSKENVAGTEIETFTDSNFTISLAHADRQVLFATDRQTLLDALARRAGNGPRSLADTDEWKDAEKEFVDSPDVTGFLSYEKFLKAAFAMGGRDAAMLDQVRDVLPKTFTVSTKFDGRLMRERAFVDSRMVPPRIESKHRSRAFTGEDTLAYLEAGIVSSGFDFQKLWEGNPIFKGLAADLGKHGLVVADIAKAFGPELAVVSDWESGGLAFPALFVAAEVRDAEKARKFADMITEAMSANGPLLEKDYHGTKLWSAKAAIPLMQPTLALNGTHLMFGLNQGSVTSALAHAASGKSALAESAAFIGALKTVGEPNAGLAYLDSARLFERLYDRARPFIANAIAGNPQISALLDVSKLPKTATLSRHLPPFVASLQSRMRGALIETTGPVTYVTGVGGLAFIAGFSIPLYQSARLRALERHPKQDKAL